MSEAKVRVILIEANDVSCVMPLLAAFSKRMEPAAELPAPVPIASEPKPQRDGEPIKVRTKQVRKRGNLEPLREICKLLANGPRRQAELVEELGRPFNTVHAQLNHEWLHKMESGQVRLTKAGETEGLEAEKAAS